MQNHESFIISIEGLDASGKTTLSKEVYNYFYNYLIKDKFKSFNEIKLVNFPDYDSIAGQSIKTLLNRQLDIDLRKVIATLFALDRQIYDYGLDHNKKIMIFNRYYESNICYNFDLDLGWLLSLETKSYKPNITFILDINPKISLKRRSDRRDNYEKDLDYLEKVRQRYLELADKFQWIVLNGDQNP